MLLAQQAAAAPTVVGSLPPEIDEEQIAAMTRAAGSAGGKLWLLEDVRRGPTLG